MWRWVAVVAVTLGASFDSLAQQQRPAGPGDFKLVGITQKLVEAPDYGTFTKELGSPSQGSKKRWLKIEATFSSAPPWADDVQLKYWVLMGRGNNAKLFAGEVTHVNVERGQGHYSAMFVHPTTIERFGSGQAEAVAVQLYYKGVLMGQESDPPSSVRWWERLSPLAGYILSPDQTPWSVIAHKRYEAVKPRP
jgi:hypothetical protein